VVVAEAIERHETKSDLHQGAGRATAGLTRWLLGRKERWTVQGRERDYPELVVKTAGFPSPVHVNFWVTYIWLRVQWGVVHEWLGLAKWKVWRPTGGTGGSFMVRVTYKRNMEIRYWTDSMWFKCVVLKL
jgi:hypothetical protein